MAIRYWVANGVSAATADTDANWNTAAAGTGSPGKPAANDTVVFHASNDKGFAPCTWDLTTAVDEVFVDDAYGEVVSLETNHIQFVATGAKITLGDNQSWGNFSVGMGILVNGTTHNDGTYEIASILTGSSADTITVTGSLTDETIAVADGIGVGISSIERTITLTQNMSTQALRLGCKLDAGSAKSVIFSGAIITSGTAGDYSNRYILNGKNAGFYNIGNITYAIDGSSWSTSSSRLHFDTGPHPIVTCSTATYFSPQYKTPTSTEFGETTTFYKLQLTNTGNDIMAPITTVNAAANDSKKIFVLQAGTTDQLDYDSNQWDAGLSTWGFTARSAGFEIPVTGSTTYGNGDFSAKWHGIHVLGGTAAGDYCLISSSKKLYCNNLTIAPNTLLKGSLTGSTENDIIQLVKKPMIYGSWNFVRVSEGIYHSNPQLNNAYYDNLIVRDKLTVGGIIDPTGLVLDEQADHPVAPTAGKGILWVKNDTPNELYFTDDAGTDTQLGAGGGGVSLSGSTDNTITTVTGSNAIQGEANLTFDGSTLALTGDFNVGSGDFFVDDSTGKVGIGTASPDEALHLSDADGSEPTILIENTGTAGNEPEIVFWRSTGTGADSRDIGHIKFKADDTAGNLHTFAQIYSDCQDADSGTEDGRIIFDVAQAGTDGVEHFRMQGGSVVVNETSADIDFRVEGNSETHLLYTDAGNDRVGIGTDSPDSILHLQASSGDNPILTLETTSTSASAEPSLTFDRSTGSGGSGAIADGDNIGQIIFKSRNDAGTPETINYVRMLGEVNDVTDGSEDGRFFLYMMKNGSEVEYLRVAPGQIIINNDGADVNFVVEGDTDANLFVCDAGTDAVKIAGASSKVGFYGATAVTKTAVADITPSPINPDAPSNPTAAEHASTAAAVAALENKLNELLDALQALGLV